MIIYVENPKYSHVAVDLNSAVGVIFFSYKLGNFSPFFHDFDVL